MLSGLAQPAALLAANKRFASEVFIWLGVIVALAILLGLVALWLRKKLATAEKPTPVGFTLTDLRAMHAAGQLTDEELASAEAKTLTSSRSLYLGKEPESTIDDADGGEPEDIGHLSTANEDAPAHGTENPPDGTDKNTGDGPLS